MNDNLILDNLKLIIIGTLAFLILIATSCRSGYGCHGNQSWNKMVSRNNKFN